ncbi:MAG: hypothetical protein JW706_07110, partial [Opitutales bacterium]|nr:hypothetical protein [Opitutales bacterium]
PSGWVRFSNFSHVPIETVTVRAFEAWPTTVFSVAAPSGSGNDAKITAALDLAKANGGGVVLIPEGTYLLTQPVLIPSKVILRGAGRTKTFLKWVNNPRVSNPTLAGLVMNLNYTRDEPFGLEDLSLEITNNDYWGPVVYRGFTRVPSVFQRVDIKAPLLDTSIEDNMPFGIHLRRTSNLRIHDVSVVASKGIFGRDDVTHLSITDSTVTWNNFGFKFSAKNRNLIINNNVVLVSGPTRTHTSLGLTPFHSTDGPYNRDFLWANNRIAAAEDFEDHSGGYTADGSDGIYLGTVSGCDGNTMTLAGSTSTVDVGGKPVDYIWTGAVAVILDGRGAGQWRYLIGTRPGDRTVTLDRPWDILPDANSIVTLIHMMGRYLMIDNDYVNDGQHDDYYISNDSIKAGNRFGTVVKTFTATTWTGRHYLGTFPGLHVQFLDNSFVRDAPSLIKTLVDNTPESAYQGIVLSGHVYRNNVDVSPGVGPTTIQFRTNEGRASDALFEGNTIDLLSFRQADENMDVQNILVRGNLIPGSSTPTTLNPVAPIPGVTVIP